jgi:hypothetical protein
VPALSLDYEFPFIMPYGDSIVATPREFVTPAVPRFESGSTMTFGGSPTYLLIVWYNNTFGTNSMHFRTLFRGMLREDRNSDISDGIYSLFDKDGTKLFTKSLAEPRAPLELTPDRYKAVFTSSNYWLRNAKGTVTLTSEFNLGNGFASDPPTITSFMVLDKKGHPTDAFLKGEQATLLFSVNNGSLAGTVLPLSDSTRAWYREHGTSQWIPLAVTKIAEVAAYEGIIVQADLTSATTNDSVAIDLRVASKDTNGFTVDQVVAPAFAVGNWKLIETDVARQEGPPARFALEQNYPNPFNPATTIIYQVPALSHVILTVYDLLGREVATLVDENKKAGRYSIPWNASWLSSGVYFYRLRAGEFRETKRMILLK